MKLYYEWGLRQINKGGEELCGDSIAVSRQSSSVTLALSDGLGSGVQANILATLTTQIATHLLEKELPLGEVVKTLSKTLPVCKTRKLAYSTFAIAKFFSEGTAKVVMFDSPSAIFIRKRKIMPIACEERNVEGKAVSEYVVDLKAGDWAIFVSDGVLNAGIGGLYPLGWGWEKTAAFLEAKAHPKLSAQELSDKVAEAVSELYQGAPGDDVSIIVIKVRRKQFATVLTGPPIDRSKNDAFVSQFLKRTGKLAVSGGTTAKIVARHLGQTVDIDLNTMTSDVPAQARIEGLDVVTEGILTLTAANALLQSDADRETVAYRSDGAANLLRLLLEADAVHFMVGQAVNPAHQNPELPQQLAIRLAVVREIADELRRRGKEVTIESV